MRKILLSIFATATAAGALAQGVVSLDSCRNMALNNNKAIRIAEENIKGAGYLRDAADLGWNVFHIHSRR